MLSEAWQLTVALDRAGIALPIVHPRVKSPGRTTGDCLRVRLGSEGQVVAVEEVTEDEWGGLWTIMEGNQNSFPVVRVNTPLLPVPRDHKLWSELGFNSNGKRDTMPSDTERLRLLRRALSDFPVELAKSDKLLWLRLRDKKAKELEDCATGVDPNSEALRQLAKRFRQAAQKPEHLLKEFAQQALRRLGDSRLGAWDTVEALLVGKGPRDPSATIQLAFDVEVLSEGTRLYSNRMQDYVKKTLPEGARRKGKGKAVDARPCALSGAAGTLQDEAFPKVRFPVLNKDFALVSMFSEARCNQRYGLADSHVVPVRSDVAIQLKASLEWILDDAREGKTWRGVASGRYEKKKEKKDLLIVYVEGKPDVNANVAAFFGAGKDLEEKQFDVDARAVCDALSGIEKERPGSRLSVFVLRRASEGQAQVVLAETPTVREILDAAARWQRAVRDNLPVITLRLPPKAKGGKAVEGHPRAPYPDEVVQLLARQWVTKGTRSYKVQGVSLGDVLAMMLRRTGKWQTAALHMLDLGMRRFGPLLLGIFGIPDPAKTDYWKPYPSEARTAALQSSSLVGILLDALGRNREDYVMGTAFQIGRLLSMADTLHREYCRHQRHGAIPPQLIGNALMPVAADNPQDAIDRLRERMGIYKAWATQKEGGEFALAKWAVSQMGYACHVLTDTTLPTQTDQTFRAELFLGYMAREPQTKADTRPMKEETNEG